MVRAVKARVSSKTAGVKAASEAAKPVKPASAVNPDAAARRDIFRLLSGVESLLADARHACCEARAALVEADEAAGELAAAQTAKEAAEAADGGGELPSLITTLEAVALLRCSKSHFCKLRAEDPEFPRPLKLSERFVRWRSSDIELYLAAREGR